ncbi:MAG TPA: DNA-directed RNA polymerase subunit delta [Candidatus Bathyarchaeia archaeon]|nr:DNA-directed RNA polymerase subunit delta [Candidatus Bathyarchaeia archaeon]
MSQILSHIEAEKLSEMALVDIAYEILVETKRPYNFRELMDEISVLRNLSNEEKMGMIAQVYTEVNIDGRFVCIGENTWGLKRWYSTDAVEESQEGGGKKKKIVLDDDFDDDYELEEELVEDFEDDDVAVFEDDEFVDADDIDEIDEELEDEDSELIEEEEMFEDDEEETEDELEEELDDEDD